MESKKLLLIDAYAMIFRAFYAMMRNSRVTSTGVDTSAVFGFVNILQDILKREQPSHIAVCFDPGGKTFRHEAYPDYKANRSETPEGIIIAVPYIKRILEAYNIPVYQVPGYEADDVIGTLAHLAQEKGFMTYMVTGDKDFGQLVTDKVKVYNPAKNEILGVDQVNEKYGINNPHQLIDILALMGDSADNIPGCPGVGPKTAEKLIQKYENIENVFDHVSELKGALKTRIESNIEQIKFSKYLATIITHVPLELDEDALKRVPANMEALRKVFGELEFRTLTTRLIDRGEANVGLNVLIDEGTTTVQSLFDKPAANAGETKTNSTGQLSLFDDVVPETSAPVEQRMNIDTTEHNYDLVTDFDTAAGIVTRLMKQEKVAIHAVTSGEEAMRATIVGLAMSDEKGRAVYMPCDDMGWMMNAVAPLFAGDAMIICNDVKRIMVILHRAGVKFTAPYYDTAVAHYLLQPERSHSTAAMAAEVMNYDAMSEETVVGKKGRKQVKISQVKPDVIKAYACEQADLTLQLYPVLNSHLDNEGITHLFTDIEQPLIKVLASMEIAGARIDKKALDDYAVTLNADISNIEAQCRELAGEDFNTASPAQVGEILFDKLKLDAKAKKTKTGQYSTTEEILLHLRDRHPIVEKILELRGKRKLLSTYVTALPQLINPLTGRVHTTFNQTVTATGRLSSTNPNLQNIPVRTDEGKEIRRAFIPAEGNVFFSADYSQIELRLVADISDDATMIDAFAHDRDIHAITASKIYHVPLDEVTPEQRRRAKTANFGILYGISAFGLSERLNIPRSEAKMLIDGYFETFPQVRDYIDSTVAQAREKCYVTTLYGRRRMLPDINSRNAVVRAFNERNAVNAPIQGTAADIIKRAMVAIYNRFEEQHLKSKMILQVHDELNFDVVPQELEAVEKIVISEMEKAYSGKVKLTASHAAASNWLDAH